MEDHENCPNCKRDIPQQNFRMHSLHCARNIALCPDCQEPVTRSELEAHRAELHSLSPCPLCGERVESCKLSEHQTEVCPKRSALCKYCATHVEHGTLPEHENYCGSRTEKCQDCKEFIMLKNWELHISSNHGFVKLNDEPGPKPSWENPSKPSSATTATTTTPYQSKYSKYSDPSPSTPSQRANFTPTELFNNQDLYSSRRYSSTTASSSSSLLKSSSSAALINHSSSSNSIVNKMLNGDATTTAASRFGSSAVASGIVASKSTSVVNESSSSRRRDAAASSEPTTEEERLPCEFCERMIPMYKLLSHQAECVNPTNVRETSSSAINGGGGSMSRSASYRAYSSLRESSLTRTSSLRTSSTDAAAVSSSSTSVVSKYLRPSEDSTKTSSVVGSRYSSGYSRTTAAESTEQQSRGSTGGSSIVGRYVTDTNSSPSSRTRGPTAETSSPPRCEKSDTSSFYNGRSTYLKEEAALTASTARNAAPTAATAAARKSAITAAPGMYDNEADREGLRQMLSSLRRDPMDVEDDPDNNDGSFFPCEFCGDPYPSEFIMRHQMSCDLNPTPVSSGSGFDYSQIQKSIARNLGIDAPPPTSTRAPASINPEDVRRSARALSRSNSVVERSYSRTGRASSVSRTSSFADRSYGTRTSLARQCSFSIADYGSAVRRSSVFDGYAGYSIYSSISDGLDQITYGGRSSRRNSVTDLSYNFSSRRGSVSAGGGGGDYPLPALMAALDATKASQEERKEKYSSSTAAANAHVNGQANSYLSSNVYSNGYSRQNSSTDSPHGIDSPFGAVNGNYRSAELERSDSKGLMRRKSSIKHSSSGYKLERKVSFHNHDQIINNGVDENGQPITDKPDKPKRKKERTEEEKAARRERKERKERKRQERGQSKDRRPKGESKAKSHPMGDDLVEQLSAKLQDIERDQQQEQEKELGAVPSSSLFPGLEESPATHQHHHQHQASTRANQPADPSNYSSSSTTTTTTSHTSHANIINTTEAVAAAATTTTTTTAVDNKLTVNRDNIDHHQQNGWSNGVENGDEEEGDEGEEDRTVVALRNSDQRSASKAGSKRNSLDNKSVQSLAKDLAAECAKAYELMESSLSKLTNDFSIGPFGLTPKNKKKYRAPPAPPLK